MRHKVLAPRLVISTMLAIGLIIGINSAGVNATVSTSYQIVSPRTPSGAYTDTAQVRMESPRSVSGDGHYAVFLSGAANLVSNDTNGKQDIFVRDTVSGITSLVSISSSGSQANEYSSAPSISYDGRYVVFSSRADNLTSGVTGTTKSHIYIRDLVASTTNLVDVSVGGATSDGNAYNPKISADGRFVVFSASSTNLVAGVSSSIVQQIYIKDMHNNSVKALSVTSAGVVGNKDSTVPDVSCSGNVVVFATMANNLGVPSQNGRLDLVTAHIGWDKVELDNVTDYSSYGISAGQLSAPQISCDGNKALFISSSTNILSPSTPSGYVNVYQFNRLTGNTIQVNLGNGNVQADSSQQGQSVNASMSGDGRYVMFDSYANNMDTTYPYNVGYSGSGSGVYIRDIKNSVTETAAVLPNGYRSEWSVNVGSISGDGSRIVFTHTTPASHMMYASRALVSGLNTGIEYSPATDLYTTTTNY